MKRAAWIVMLCALTANAAPPATVPASKDVAEREIRVEGMLVNAYPEGGSQDMARDILNGIKSKVAEAAEKKLLGAFQVATQGFVGTHDSQDNVVYIGGAAIDIGPKSAAIRYQVDTRTVSLPDLKGKADAMADAMGEIFKADVTEVWQYFRKHAQDDANARAEDLDRAEKKSQRLRMQAEATRNELRDTTHRTDLSSAAFKEAIGSLEIERQKLELDLAGMKARREALDGAVAEQSARAAKAAEGDPVAGELKELVGIREKQLQFVTGQANGGVATVSDQQNAAAAVAEAKARLAERKLAAAGPADVLSAWNRQLLDLTVDLREKEARLAAISEMLKSFSGAVEKAQSLENIVAASQQAASEADNARDAAMKARDELRNYETPLKITITPIQSSPAVSN